MHIVQWISSWLAMKSPKTLETASRYENDWERWARLDMALVWRADQLPEVETTVKPYKSTNLSADFVIKVTRTDTEFLYNVVELSTFYHGSSDVKDWYQTQLGAGIVKVRGELVSPYGDDGAFIRRNAVGLVPVAVVKDQFNHGPAIWSDEETLHFVKSQFATIEVPASDEVVNLEHVVASAQGKIVSAVQAQNYRIDGQLSGACPHILTQGELSKKESGIVGIGNKAEQSKYQDSNKDLLTEETSASPFQPSSPTHAGAVCNGPVPLGWDLPKELTRL